MTNAPIESDPAQADFVALARGLVDGALDTYGFDLSLYGNILNTVTDPNFHDFRLAELPAVTGDASLGTRPLRILDIGCGPGGLVFKACRLGHDAHGIDVDVEKITLAKAWLRAQKLPPEWSDRIAICDGADLPFPNESFDVVTSYHVLEHVADLRSILHEAVRVTKRGGWLELRAPDYRMSYDTHYCMPWPRFMPPKQARQWTDAMGRPAGGIGTFYYVTSPEVVAILESLGCRIQTNVLREHYQGRVTPFSGRLPLDPILVRSDADMSALATELKRLAKEGTLPAMYATCLEFGIAAQRL